MNKLINIKPEPRQKGFKQENFISSIDFKTQSLKILKSLQDISKEVDKFDLTKSDIEIYNLIVKSYENLLIRNKQEENDFILTNHELNEIEKINYQKIIKYLVYRYKYNVYPKKKIIDGFPPCVQIEPTSICNFRCVMCYQADKSFSSKSNGFMGHMKLDIFKKIIDQLEGNVEAITLASRGEPTLNPNIEEMINYCSNKFLAFKINTNASMLNEKLIHTLLASNLQTIVFSIDSKDKESYEKIRVNGNFEKTIRNLELFNNIRNKHYRRSEKIVRISGVKINSEQNIDEMKKKWGDIADIVAFTNYTPWESSYENNENNIIEPCHELWTRMFVWWDGKVNPCDYDYKSVLSKWDVNHKSIKDIWNSEEYNLLRKNHLEKKRNTLEPCKRCFNA
jgi:MoaA/NifB/PqqE/SkfB family radical SAM enzyme